MVDVALLIDYCELLQCTCSLFCIWRQGLYQIWLFLIRPEPDLAGFRNSNPAGHGSRFGEKLFWDHGTIQLMKLMASAMLSAAIRRQCGSVLPSAAMRQCSSLLPLLHLFCQFLMKFVKRQMDFVFLYSEQHLTKSVNTSLDRSAVLVLFLINWTYCRIQIRLESEDSAKFPGKWPDSRFSGPGAEIWHICDDVCSVNVVDNICLLCRQLMTRWRRRSMKLLYMQKMTRNPVQKSCILMYIQSHHLAFRSVVVIHLLTTTPNDLSVSVPSALHYPGQCTSFTLVTCYIHGVWKTLGWFVLLSVHWDWERCAALLALSSCYTSCVWNVNKYCWMLMSVYRTLLLSRSHYFQSHFSLVTVDIFRMCFLFSLVMCYMSLVWQCTLQL